jgi:hypothetical protein
LDVSDIAEKSFTPRQNKTGHSSSGVSSFPSGLK